MSPKTVIVTYLLEPDLEACVKDGNERKQFLATTLRDCGEVGLVFRGKERGCRGWVPGKEILDSLTQEWGSSRDLKDCNTDAFAPPPVTPPNLSPTNRQSKF